MIEKIPSIELNEGIPSNIDFDEFLEVSRRIIYDLMTQPEGDKHIANLFVKGVFIESTLFKIYFIKVNKRQTSVSMPNTLHFSNLRETNNRSPS